MAAVLFAAGVVASAPPAAADPQILVPYCSGDQTPMDTDCQPMPHQAFVDGSGPDPYLPSGLDPGAAPVI